MAKTFTAVTAACAFCIATVATTPARAMDPWTAALWLVSGVYIGSVYGMPYAYAGGAYRAGPYGYPPPAYGYPPPHGYAAQSAYAGPPAPAPRVDKDAPPCMPATMMIDGVQRQVRICY